MPPPIAGSLTSAIRCGPSLPEGDGLNMDTPAHPSPGERAALSLTHPKWNATIAYVAMGTQDDGLLERSLSFFGLDVQTLSETELSGSSAITREHIAITVFHSAYSKALLGVARLRYLCPRTWLIVASDFPDSSSRGAAMLAGADACADASADSLELVASILAASRRVEQGESSSQPTHAPAPKLPREQWELTENEWMLRSPKGVTIELNQIEREILGELLSYPDQPLRREAWNAKNPGDRNLDVAISRLRKKAAKKHIHLPIQCVRRVGYVFVTSKWSSAHER